MADQLVSNLPALSGADVDPADLLYIVDSSAGVAGSKKITVGQYQLAPVSGGTVNGVVYLDANKVETTSAGLTYNGTTLSSTGGYSGPAALSGTPTAPTAAYGTNTTQIATTAFVQAALQALHPVGSIYINATDATNPGTLFGFGTWTAFGAGRVPVGFDAGNALFDTAEETGGSADAIVVSHTHTATSTFTGSALGTHTHSITDPGHSHGIPDSQGTGSTFPNSNTNTFSSAAESSLTATTGISISAASAGTPTGTVATTVASAGSSGTNANYQPYITVYMWKRTA